MPTLTPRTRIVSGRKIGSRTNGSKRKIVIFRWVSKTNPLPLEPCIGRLYLLPVQILDGRQPVDTMKKIVLATAAILAFAAPAFAAEPAKTVGQAPPSFYLAQDAATMKCQIVETEPVAGGGMKVVGAAHSTKASAETALKADKTCAK